MVDPQDPAAGPSTAHRRTTGRNRPEVKPSDVAGRPVSTLTGAGGSLRPARPACRTARAAAVLFEDGGEVPAVGEAQFQDVDAGQYPAPGPDQVVAEFAEFGAGPALGAQGGELRRREGSGRGEIRFAGEAPAGGRPRRRPRRQPARRRQGPAAGRLRPACRQPAGRGRRPSGRPIRRAGRRRLPRCRRPARRPAVRDGSRGQRRNDGRRGPAVLAGTLRCGPVPRCVPAGARSGHRWPRGLRRRAAAPGTGVPGAAAAGTPHTIPSAGAAGHGRPRSSRFSRRIAWFRGDRRCAASSAAASARSWRTAAAAGRGAPASPAAWSGRGGSWSGQFRA